MFEQMYKKVDEKIEPSLDLINKTKLKMKEELNNSNKVVHINFYKYATIAACLMIFIGVLSINTSQDMLMEQVPSINESYNETFENDSIARDEYFSSENFASTDTVNTAVAIPKTNSVLYEIAEFFISIIQWFKELLF